MNYDYPFSTPTKNAVNKRIIERPISFPRLRRGNNTKKQPFCIISNTHQNWESKLNLQSGSSYKFPSVHHSGDCPAVLLYINVRQFLTVSRKQFDEPNCNIFCTRKIAQKPPRTNIFSLVEIIIITAIFRHFSKR